MDNDCRPSLPAGASAWEKELFDHLTTHMELERGMLEEYRAAALETDSKAFAYIVDLLGDEERRHHELFAALAQSLKTEAEMSSRAPAVPYMDFDRADRERARELTK